MTTAYSHYGINYNPEEFKIWYPVCTRTAGTWLDEIKIAATLLKNNTDRDVWVCMSGGIDSEIVAYTLKKLKINVMRVL